MSSVSYVPPFRCASSLAARTVSTSRDLIWTMILVGNRRFDITLLSIRTSGCRARIVVFTEENHEYNTHFSRVIHMTETEIYRMNVSEPFENDLLRFQWIHFFLMNHTLEFDKVFMMDAYDVFFHRDPFEALFFADTLVLVQEGLPIDKSTPNSAWLNQCFGSSADPINSNMTLCSGTTFGPTAVYISFVQLLLAKWPRPQCSFDQPVVNYLFYTGEFEKTGIKVKIVTCLGPVMTMYSCPNSVARVGDVEETFNEQHEIPYVVHQWNRVPDLVDAYPERCNMTAYMKKRQKVLNVDLDWSPPVEND